MKIRCNIIHGDWELELDCRSFHADPINPDSLVFMAPEWHSTQNEAAHELLGSALCRVESDGSRPLLSVRSARSYLAGVRIVDSTLESRG